MSGDNNNKNRKEEMNHMEDENSKSSITKQAEEKVAKHELESEHPDEILETLPPKMRERIETFMGSIAGPFVSPLESKLNEKHIDKILEIKEKYEDRVFKDTQQSRKFQLGYVLIGVSVFVFLTLLLVGKETELFKEIIKLFVAFVGGMGAGFGIKSHISSK